MLSHLGLFFFLVYLYLFIYGELLARAHSGRGLLDPNIIWFDDVEGQSRNSYDIFSVGLLDGLHWLNCSVQYGS